MKNQTTDAFSREQQAIIVKGIAETMLKLSFPSFQELDKSLNHFGYSVKNNQEIVNNLDVKETFKLNDVNCYKRL